MYLLTYVGAILNGLTILTLAWVAAFTGPRIYRLRQITSTPVFRFSIYFQSYSAQNPIKDVQIKSSLISFGN